MTKRTAAAFLFILTAFIFFAANAQSSVSPDDRQRWISEIRTYKHEFLAKELDLTRDQQNSFFPLYDEMEDRIEDLNAETRELETRVTENADAGDIEVLGASRAVFELKKNEGEIELSYYDKFKDILSPRQLLQLKSAERQFTRQLLDSHHRMRRSEHEH